MSMIHFDSMSAAAADSIVVSLTGGTASHGTGASSAIAGWQTRADGTMWKKENQNVTQHDSGSVWIFPRTTFDPADYEVRMNHTGGAPDYGDSVDAWLAMSSTRFWEWECNNPCAPPIYTLTFDIRHASDGSKNTESSNEDGAPCMATSSAYSVFIEAT